MYLSNIDANNASYNANTDSGFTSFLSSDTITTTTADDDGNFASAPLTGVLASVSIDAGGSNYSVGDDITVSGGGGSGGGVNIQDEGSLLSTTATTLNFVGDGIVASGSGATKTITVGAASTSELRANTLEVVGVTTFGSTVNVGTNVSVQLGINKIIKGTSAALSLQSFSEQDIILESNSGGMSSQPGDIIFKSNNVCLLYTSPSPRD